MNPWTLLGIEPTRDTVAIKRAYARLLKRCRPDDDAAAYQRLRESYEWALQWAQYATDDDPADADIQANMSPVAPAEAGTAEPAPATMEVPTPQPVADAPMSSEPSATAEAGMAASSATEPDPAPVDPEGLARSFYAYFEEKGADAAVAALPALESWLDSIALSRRDEASRWFASLVAEVPGLPDPVVTKLVEYFGWLSDYRSAAVLGHDRLEALRARALKVGLLPMRDPDVLRRFRRLIWLHHAQQQKQDWLARLLALGLDGRDRERWEGSDYGLRRSLGLSASSAMDDTLDRSSRMRYRMLWITLYVLAMVDPLGRGGGLLSALALTAAPLLLATYADVLIAQLVHRVPTPPQGWRWAIAVTAPLLAAAAYHWVWHSVVLIILGTVAAVVQGWAMTRRWRSVPVVQAAAATWILAASGADPIVSWCGSLSVAFAYAAVSDLNSDQLLLIARKPLSAWLPSTGWGWFWVFVCLKFVILILVALPIALSPFVSLLQAERHGMRFALLTLGAAAALAGALRLSANEAAALLVAAPWLSGMLQRSIQHALGWWAQRRLASTAG